MGGEKKPLVMSELGCADGCGRLRTANGPELRGRLRTARVRGSGWKWVGRRSRWRSAAQFSAPISRPQPSAQPSSLIPSGFWRTHFQPLPCTHAVGSRPRNSPHPFAVRSRPRSQARSSPAASSPEPFPATPLHILHPRRPQPSAQFSAPICRPQPCAQPRSAADGVGAREWVEMGGETNKMQPTNPNAHTYVNGYAVTQNISEQLIFCNNLFI